MLLSVSIAAMVGVQAWLGMRVTTHTPLSPRAKTTWHVLFVVCAAITIALVGVQAWRSEKAQEKLQSQIDTIQRQTEQPPKVTIDSAAIARALSDVNRQLALAKRLPSSALRRGALKLSSEVLQFLAERTRDAPPYPPPGASNWLTSDRYKYDEETRVEYAVRFASIVRSVVQHSSRDARCQLGLINCDRIGGKRARNARRSR
jgi:hypothetical protein